MHVSNITQQGESRADVGLSICLVPESLLLVVSLMFLVSWCLGWGRCTECGKRKISHLSCISKSFRYIIHVTVLCLLYCSEWMCPLLGSGKGWCWECYISFILPALSNHRSHRFHCQWLSPFRWQGDCHLSTTRQFSLVYTFLSVWGLWQFKTPASLPEKMHCPKKKDRPMRLSWELCVILMKRQSSEDFLFGTR